MHRSSPLALAVIIAVAMTVAASCTLDWSVPSSATDASDVDGATPGDASAEANEANVVVPIAPPDGPVDPSGSCRDQTQCAGDSLVCVFEDFGCGVNTTGRCEPRSEQSTPDPTGDCPTLGLYCGCDGNQYPSACAALAAGVDLSISACKASTASTLGYASCESGNGGVLLVHDPLRNHANVYRCVSAPTDCNADCACLGQRLCVSTKATCDQGHILCQ